MNETEPENLVLQQLRALRNAMAEMQRELRQGFTTVENRLGRVETALGELHGDYASLLVRIDQLQAETRALKTRYETVG
ncbi:MAG: hypothetical protein ACT4PZ_17100 [Panacagrimonas sp.]